ncbi:MAG: beta strand repeat-containing protein [Verrucomicrobiales bacterium]
MSFAEGIDFTWDGDTNATWATSTNWTADFGVPETGDTAIFNDAGNGNTVIDLAGAVTVGGITFDTASVAEYTIGAGAVGTDTLNLDSGASITSTATNTNNQFFNADLVLGSNAAAGTYSVSSNAMSLIFAGDVTGGAGGTAGAKTLVVGGALNSQLNGTISDGGATSLALIKSGAGSLSVTGTNAFSGGTMLNDGRLNINNSNAIGSGPLTLNGGLLFENGDSVVLENDIFIDGMAAIQASAGGNLTLNGVVTGSGTLNTGGVAPPSSVIFVDDLSGFTGAITHENVNNDNNLTFLGAVNTTARFSTSGPTGSTRSVGFNAGATIGELSGSGGRLRTSGSLVVNQSTTTSYAGSLQNAASTMSLEKQGVGALDLSGPNTYTGDTTVTAGTLTLADGGRLTFAPSSNGVSNQINGVGTLALEGEVFLNLGGADTTDGNSWLLVDVDTLSESYEETFTVSSSLGAFTQTADVWTLAEGANAWTFTEATGVLTVETAGGYGSWAAGFASLTDTDPGLDFDGGSLATGVEYVVGGDPTDSSDDTGFVPISLVDDAGNLVFTFRRSDLANDDPNTTIEVEYGSDLLGWTTADDTDPGVSVEVTEDGFGAGVDQVDVTLAPSLAVGGKIFTRLNVVIVIP